MMIAFVVIVVLSIVTLGVLLTSRREDKSRQIVHTFFAPRPRFGADPRKTSSWLQGDWFVGERLNDAIAAGKKHYAQKQGHRQPRQSRHHR